MEEKAKLAEIDLQNLKVNFVKVRVNLENQNSELLSSKGTCRLLNSI